MPHAMFTLSSKLNYGMPKMSDDGVESVNDVDLEEYPQSNGCQFVASEIEAREKVSRAQQVEHSPDEMQIENISSSF